MKHIIQILALFSICTSPLHAANIALTKIKNNTPEQLKIFFKDSPVATIIPSSTTEFRLALPTGINGNYQGNNPDKLPKAEPNKFPKPVEIPITLIALSKNSEKLYKLLVSRIDEKNNNQVVAQFDLIDVKTNTVVASYKTTIKYDDLRYASDNYKITLDLKMENNKIVPASSALEVKKIMQ